MLFFQSFASLSITDLNCLLRLKYHFANTKGSYFDTCPFVSKNWISVNPLEVHLSHNRGCNTFFGQFHPVDVSGRDFVPSRARGIFPGRSFGLRASGEGRWDSVGLCVSRPANAPWSTLIFSSLFFFFIFWLTSLAGHKSVTNVVQSFQRYNKSEFQVSCLQKTAIPQRVNRKKKFVKAFEDLRNWIRVLWRL